MPLFATFCSANTLTLAYARALLAFTSQDDLDALHSDVSRLRASIAEELRRSGNAGAAYVAPPPSRQPVRQAPPAPPPQRGPLTSMPLPSSQPPPPQPAQRMKMDDDDDDEIPSFQALRASLYGYAPTSVSAAEDMWSHFPVPPPNTVHVRAEAPRVSFPGCLAEGGAAAGAANECSDAALSTNFEELRASISSKLRDASAGMMRASGVPLGPDTAFLEPVAETEAEWEPAAAAGVSGQMPTMNTVVLTARKPGGLGGGMTVVASLDRATAACHGASLGPSQRRRVNVTTAGAAASIAAEDAAEDAGDPIPTAGVCAARAAAAASTTAWREGGEGVSAQAEMTFGFLAMRSALESHRAHYETARSQLPAVGQFRPNSGVRPPPAAPVPKSMAVLKPPTLATASRGRPSADAWTEAMPAEKPLTARSLNGQAPRATWAAKESAGDEGEGAVAGAVASKARVASTATVRAKKVDGGVAFGNGGAAPPPKRTVPTAAKAGKPKIPISRPAVGGMSGGGAAMPPNNAPLGRVTGPGLPPNLERTRETERLVASIAQSAPPPAPEGPAEAMAALRMQLTEGLGSNPLSAQQAWRAQATGAARQAEVLGAVAAHSARLYQTTIESITAS